MGNEILRIFLSSTAIDMQDHRKAVQDAILRQGNLPVAMEVFGALPNEPVDVCKTKVKESDALVVMLAHRYGWVPSIEEGGDGEKSITWIEVETALANNIPVFVYIVDDKHPWTAPTEQDQLNNAKDDKDALEVYKKVKALKEFKQFLSSKAGLTRDTFTTAENLAMKVATSLSNWQPGKNVPQKGNTARPRFVFRTVHHLQPAPHFRGRKDILSDLQKWWQQPVTPDRVRSLVAIGGTGKTAIIERFLYNIVQQSLRGSVLVWSFYDEPNTDAFLREACIVFTGEEPQGAGGKLEKLQRFLAAENQQHLLVLDGLERVQSEGKDHLGHAKGDLEDHRLKNLLRSVAAGLGNTRMLITSRFKLTDLAQWEGAGYKSHELDVLDRESAIEVLKAWQITGTDDELDKIALSIGRHALSVSVLGSYLNHYCQCNPNEVKDFKLDEITPDEPLAARLGRILGGYAKNLPDAERDLLVRLSVFPKGITVDILQYLIDAGGEIAGLLIGCNQKKLLLIAERLKQQGLIYSYNNNNTIVYTAHPFLRDYFRNLLGVKPENIHEVVMNQLAIGLDTKPVNKPADAETLDRYEQLIEHSILAGHYREAYDLFQNTMGGDGGDSHIYHTLGDYGRIIRIVSFCSTDGTPQSLNKSLAPLHVANLNNYWGMAASTLGDLRLADSCFVLSTEIYRKNISRKNFAQGIQNRAWIFIQKGLFRTAKRLLEESLDFLKQEDKNDDYVKYVNRYTNAYLAYTFHLLGEIPLSKKHFEIATEIEGVPLYSIDGFYETEHLFLIGEKEKTLERAKENLDYSANNFGQRTANYHRYILGVLSLPGSISASKEHLQKIREWTEKSGHMELIIRSHILAAEIAYCSGDYPAAIAEATTGLNHAESCGFVRLAIDLQLLLSKIQLAIPDYTIALSFARKALDKSEHPDCGYAWGQANGLHLCGVCHKGLKEYDLARMRLQAALTLREKIQHPEAEETRKLLAELPPVE